MTKKKKEGPNLFTFLNAIFYKKKIPYDKSIAPAYMLSLWLSHDPKLIDIVNDINHLQFLLDDGIIYQYYMNQVPKGRRFIKWVKKTPKDKRIEKRIKELTENSELSKREAKGLALFEERMNES